MNERTEEEKRLNPTLDELGLEYQENLFKFRELADDMSKKGLARVAKSLVAHPLEPDLVNIKDEDELALFNVGTEIEAIKMNMTLLEITRRSIEAQKDATKKAEVPDNIDKPEYAKENDLEFPIPESVNEAINEGS